MNCPCCGAELSQRLEVAIAVDITGDGYPSTAETTDAARVIYDCECGFSCDDEGRESERHGKGEEI